MVEQDRQRASEEGEKSSHAESVETGSVPWCDTFVSEEPTQERAATADDSHGLGESETSREPRARTKPDTVLEATPVGIVLLSAEGSIACANSRAEELLGLSRHRLDRKAYDHPDWDIWDGDGNPIPREDHPITRVLETGETITGFTHGITLPDGSERWLSSNAAPIKTADGSIERIVVAIDDVTVTKRLEQIIEGLQPVNELLNSATADGETEQAICELLTDTREYQCARIGEHTAGTAPIEPDPQDGAGPIVAGQSVPLPIQSQVEVAPGEVAVETGDIQVVTRDRTDSAFNEWRAYTLDQGFNAGAIVPVRHRARVYDLLVLYTDRREAFGSRERTLLTTIGKRIGQVLHSLKTERILHADTVAELTFESTDSASFFVSASEQLGCTIEIRNTIPASDEMVVHYASVQDASLDAFCNIAENTDWATRVRQTHQTEDIPGGDVEIGLCRQSLSQTLITEGAVVTTDTVTDGRAEVVCEVPLGTDIGSLVSRVREAFPETTLVSKREYEPAAKSDAHGVDRMLEDVFETELTDRQQLVLRAAMYGGYFQSPRRSTATEIADALSLTQSTFSYHLRNAQQTLFSGLFDRLQR